MAIISIQVDETVKIAFEGATPEMQEQLKSMIELFLKNKLQSKTLTEVMAEISDKATERGMTPDILQEILAENDD
jgi:hypothetical protein